MKGMIMEDTVEVFVGAASIVEPAEYWEDDFDPAEPTPRIKFDGDDGGDVTLRMGIEDYRKLLKFLGKRAIITVKSYE